MQYLLGGAPILSMSRDSRFWIDGEAPAVKPKDGRLNLNYLPEGPHDIKFPGFKKLEFSIVSPEVSAPSWDESYNRWTFSSKDKKWLSARSEDGVVGLDYSTFRFKKRTENGDRVLTRWADLHLTGRRSNDSNIALKILSNQ